MSGWCHTFRSPASEQLTKVEGDRAAGGTGALSSVPGLSSRAFTTELPRSTTVRLPRGRMLHHSTEPIPLATGYTPAFVMGSGSHQHLVELYVTGHDDPWPVSHRYAGAAVRPVTWPLDDDERLLLVVLGQRYLLYEESPRPLTYAMAAMQLAHLRPEARWNERGIECRVEDVRRRLDRAGFHYPLLYDKSQGRGCGNALLHNLLKGLVESTTLVPPDLELMEDDGAWPDSAP
ncbi:FHA domain-containing protein [Streptomyces blattellae]|uniref:FHA domain-containing protein n=1 Tax=Streptomyces blattellae TaxID=2569855 RepID=UPI001E3B57B3|nr:FHA domain-containing protein [Streptomyces blattellae]